jgi:hypothetical protein
MRDAFNHNPGDHLDGFWQRIVGQNKPRYRYCE